MRGGLRRVTIARVLIDHWPLRGLRVTTPRLELRLPDEEELAQLGELAAHGVHRPDQSPFLTPWTDLPPAERARHVLRQHWRCLGSWTAEQWALELAVFLDGRPVGIQDVRAREFAVRREVITGSWLGLAHQGQGIGTEMRAAVLHLVFAGLGGEQATSASFLDSAAALAVSRKLGYREDGITRDVLDGKVVISQRLRLSRSDWARNEGRPSVVLSGLAGCGPLFGVDFPALGESHESPV